MLDKYENKLGVYWKEGHILFFEFKNHTTIDLSAAQQIVRDRLLVQKNNPYPVLCIMNGVVNINKAARDYFAQQGSTMISAVAILADPNSLTFIMAWFYISVNKPQVTTKIFTHKSQALQFLKAFI